MVDFVQCLREVKITMSTIESEHELSMCITFTLTFSGADKHERPLRKPFEFHLDSFFIQERKNLLPNNSFVEFTDHRC